ncbi:MAG TPA: MMPL family transporter, partial [Candidatus Bathyarchaeia archaeon]|nr:MMPL family transporter [Candidatus Bathyarchaeia archaeon]
MQLGDKVIRNKRVVVAVWTIVFLALIPLILNYSQFIDYSVSTNSLSGSESSKAAAIIAQLSPQNSTLIVVVPANSVSEIQMANQTLTFQKTLGASGIPFYSSSSSAFFAYATFLDAAFSTNTSAIVRSTYSSFSTTATLVYSFPSAFLASWSQNGYSQNSIIQTASDAGYNNTDPYESEFVSALNQTFSSNTSLVPSQRVQAATSEAALAILGNSYPLVAAVVDTTGFNVTNFRTTLLPTVAELVSNFSGRTVTVQVLQSIIFGGADPGRYYVSEFGLLSAPSFVTRNFVSPDNSTYLVNLSFNVTDSYRGPNNFYPSQSATPQVRMIAQEYFTNAQVTGQGAIAYDNQSITSSSGFVFGLTFILLAVAVAITLSSILSPILALIFVSLATAIGYVSIYITGLLLGSVDFTVTYTLTAVILGVSTDYFVFILSRYREELRSGKPSTEALSEATKKSGFAVIVSGLTVAGSLGALSLVSDLRTWGPVLFISIIITVALETTLLPAVAGFAGPRLFLKRTLARNSSEHQNGGENRIEQFSPTRSRFYRAARFSSRRKFAVIGVIVLLAIPAAYFWFNVPTTYNFSEGLPKNLASVQSLNTINQKFGSDLIYPNFVIVNLTQDAVAPGGGLTPSGEASLERDARYLEGLQGVRQVIGPTLNSTQIGPTQASTQFIFNNGLNAYFIIFTNYDPYSSNATSLIATLRQNKQFIVGGLTSSILDLQSYYSTVYTQLEILILLVIAAILGI